MNKEELENLRKETDEMECDLVSWQNIYIDQLQNKIKYLEDMLSVQTICGYPIEEARKILSAISIEREYEIKVTMDNLQKLVKRYQEEQAKLFRDNLIMNLNNWSDNK